MSTALRDSKTLAGGARCMAKTGMVASRLGYGAMELAGAPKARDLREAEVARFLNELLDLGINYIDTSIDYGLSETLIGKTLSHRRDDYFLASKCACEVGVEGVGHRGEKHLYTGANVTAGVEQSLRRLRTDHLDLVQVHGNPTRQELEDRGVIEALLALQKKGAVRQLGISSRLPLLADFVAVDYFGVIQVPYSALQRHNEDVISDLQRSGKAIVVRGVTGRGAPAKGWATRPIGTAEGEVRAVWETAGLDALIGGMSRMEFMIRFVLSHPDVDVALVATTDLSHLKDDIAFAAKGPLDAGLLQAARQRLSAAGCGPGLGSYSGGGPTPIL